MQRKATDFDWPVHLIDAEAELFVIGTLIREWQSDAGSLIDELCFQSHDLRKLWLSCEQLAEQHITPSVSELARLSKENSLGFSFDSLLKVWESGIPGVDLTNWVSRLRDLARLRDAYRIGQQLQGGSIEAIEESRKRLQDLERVGGDSRPQTLGTILEECGGPDVVLKRPEGSVEPPWPILRATMNGGFTPKSVTILAARPSEGKTAMGWQIALGAAGSGKRTVLFSLEMGKEDLLKRIWAERCSIPLGQLIVGKPTPLQRGAIRQINAELNDWPLEMYCDKFGLSEISQIIRRRKDRIEFAVIDYLGLVNARRKFANRNEEVSYISRKIKELAMERDIPILALHQLNRASEADGHRRPQLSDLRDSGSLEQDADNVLFIYRPAAKRGSAEDPNLREVIVEKQRNGMRHVSIPYRFDGQYVRFQELGD